MHPTFSITSEDIRRLNDGQARELIARLCRAELRKKDIPQAYVTWGGDQRAKDGGVDVRVDIDSDRGIRGYIKKDQSAFQVKAENFGPGKIPGEMAPKGVLRPAIVDLAKANGAYIIVSTKDDLSDSSLSNRIKAMNACLVTHAVTGTVDVDFYDSRKIADWVEQHPPIVAWIKYTLGNPIVGWRPYAPWAYNEADIGAEYLIDDRVKIFVPNADEGCDVLTAINRLRSDLRKNASVRLVGLSGVGKTRLVQALFDKRVSTEQAALEFENVLYTDISDDPTPQPYAMMEALQLSDADCVVVVDNCGPEVHQKLTTLAKRSGSKLRLITIEYDIRDDLPEGTICYRLEGSSDEVIKQLLKRRYKVLSGPDLDKIVSFSDGNARVAFALASTTETTGELARLRDSDLFKRLFNQKNPENEGLRICAEVASLLYSFNGVDITSNSEAETLARLVEVSTVVFSRNIAELKRRGLVQERGEWRAVLPHAIANRLAALAIEALPKDVLIEVLLEKASDRVARSFSRRLGYLHELKLVREIVQEWLKRGGRFGDLAALNSTDRQIFANIAPVNQEAALDALERAAVSSDFVAVDSPDRAHFARISRSLAYETALFERAVSVLIRFALAEPEGHNHDSTRDMLKSLFYCHLSGTEAYSDQRSTVVRRLLLSSDEAQQTLGTSLLNAALEAWHFSSHYDFDFGARKRGYGWAPRTKEDVRAWYLPFLELSVEVGKKNTSLGRSVRTLLGDAVRALWVNAHVQNEIVHAAKELLLVDGWPEGWLGIRRILQYDKKALGEDSLKQLLALEHALAPRDLKGKICAKVLARGTFSYDLDDDEGEDGAENAASRYARAEKEAEDLGKAAALDSALLLDLLPDLLRPSTTNKLVHFGAGVGEEIQDFAILEAQARQILTCTEKGKANIFFFRGFISGRQRKRPEEVSDFLDRALVDEIWGTYFPELQTQIKLDEIDYARFIKSLELNIAPAWQYRYLSFGRATAPLTVQQIFALVDLIALKPDGGLFVAVDLLGMVIHGTDEKDDIYRSDLASACASFLERLDWSNLNDSSNSMDHDLDVLLNFALARKRSDTEVSKILLNLLHAGPGARKYLHSRSKRLAPFFKFYPKQTLDAIYVADEDGRYSTALNLVSRAESDRRETAIGNAPNDAFIEWCDISPKDRYIFAAQTCRLFRKESSDETAEGLVLSEMAIQVLTRALDRKAVLRIFLNRFQPTCWSGSLSAVLKQRLPLLAMLNPTDDPNLRIEIAQAQDTLRKQIKDEEAREEAEERRQTGSFE